MKKFFSDFAANLHILVILIILNLPKIDDSAALGIDSVSTFGHEMILDSKWRAMYLSFEISLLFLSMADMRLL